jgi:hypothetical protein
MTLAAFLPVFVVALGAIAIAVSAMAIGVMFKRPCLRGSCGGSAVRGANGDSLSCNACPNRHRRAAAGAHAQQPPAG